jgi:hypothetical protein
MTGQCTVDIIWIAPTVGPVRPNAGRFSEERLAQTIRQISLPGLASALMRFHDIIA